MDNFFDDFYAGKRVLVTGHTGFKGSWLLSVLHGLGADICGYALAPADRPSLYELINGDSLCRSYIADIADYGTLKAVFDDFKPEIVFHLAAQPLVLDGYKRPLYTYRTNVTGTVNLLECVRLSDSVKSVVNVTTDKVYKNVEKADGYAEEDELCGFDPYSNSKSCSELVTYSYKKSYLDEAGKAVSTLRAGNVIGGGDFAANRIVPDCVRAALAGEKITVRNPDSVRPYQHVLEPLFAYLTVARRQWENREYAGSYNVGPDEGDCVKTGELVGIFCRLWGGAEYTVKENPRAPHEAGLLTLNNTKLKETFGIRPVWDIAKALEKTVEWARAYAAGRDVAEVMRGQTAAFEAELRAARRSSDQTELAKNRRKI